MSELPNIIRVYQEADKYLSLWGLKQQGWKFELSRKKNTLGMCHYSTRTIEVSQYWLEDWEQVNDTLLHEIAHALAGSGQGHNSVWRQYARLVGCRPERCAPPGTKTSAKPNYLVKCTVCNRQWKRFRLRKTTLRATHCGKQVVVYRIKEKVFK